MTVSGEPSQNPTQDVVAQLAADLKQLAVAVAAAPGLSAGTAVHTSTSQPQLVVAGTGIRAVGQLTIEAANCIHRAERLYFSVADPAGERVDTGTE